MAAVNELSGTSDAVEATDLDEATPVDSRAVREAAVAFLCGILAVTLWPAGFTSLMGTLFPEETAERLFPLVTVILTLPIGLLAGGRTRTFGMYLVMGMVISALVILAVAALTGWILFTFVH